MVEISFSPLTEQLIERYKTWYQSLQPKEEQGVLNVDEVASRVASFYENIRGVVDWQEEHLLRKTAIGRILGRRLLLQKEGEQIAEGFLRELVRGGHFPNNTLPLSMIETLQGIIDKYAFLIGKQSAKEEAKTYHHLSLEEWLLDVAACEIEETLAPPLKERALIDYMTEDMKEKVRLPAKVGSQLIKADERKLHIGIAAERSLFHLEEATQSYHLLEKLFPSWNSASSNDLISISQSIEDARTRIEEILHHPLAPRFYQLTSTYDTPYLLLGDILEENPNTFETSYQEPEKLEGAIQKFYHARLKKLGAKIQRAAIWSTLSIFVTKIIIALLVELPVERYLTQTINYPALGISVIVPPVLMLLLTLGVRSSSEENFRRVTLEVMKLTYAKERRDTYELTLPKRRSTLVDAFYWASFLVSFGALFWALQKVELPALSTFVFLFFLSLVAFAGTRIRAGAKELLIIKEKEGILLWFFDLFSLPIIYAGKWFSGQIARYNILPLLLSFLIEIPFQVFIEFLEQWRNFLKEKKEEIH